MEKNILLDISSENNQLKKEIKIGWKNSTSKCFIFTNKNTKIITKIILLVVSRLIKKGQRVAIVERDY